MQMVSTRAPTWHTWREALAVCRCRRTLLRTIATALVVGTILFAINQLDIVLRGDASTSTWFKAGFTYLVPFAVANIGVLIASRVP